MKFGLSCNTGYLLLLPYHHPVALAKRLATLDVLSKGRMRPLTVGAGLRGDGS